MCAVRCCRRARTSSPGSRSSRRASTSSSRRMRPASSRSWPRQLFRDLTLDDLGLARAPAGATRVRRARARDDARSAPAGARRRAPPPPLPAALLRARRSSASPSSGSSDRAARSSCRSADAESRGIANGDAVLVRSNGTSVELRARVNRRLIDGVARVADEHAGELHPDGRGGEGVSTPRSSGG